jgi:rRNA maturation endonuclease Nob1
MSNQFFKKNTIYLLDSSFFFSTQQIPSNIVGILVITPDILEEIKDPMNKIRIDSLISANKLSIQEGNEIKNSEFLKKFQKYSNIKRLSSADQSLIVLALTLKEENLDKEIIIVTDDYEIQNVSKMLEIVFQPIRNKKITKIRKYSLKCKACNYIVFNNEDECENCGHQSFYYKKK